MSTATTNREQWLADRKLAIGASDVAAIIGVSPWASAWDVWADKTNRVEPWQGNKATEAGSLYERAVLDHAEQTLGPLERNVRVKHVELPIAATCDAITVDGGCPVEAKTTGLTGRVQGDWGDALTDEVPDYYLVQVHAQLLCTGAEMAYLFALIAGRGTIQYQIERSDKVSEQLAEMCADWWQKHIVLDQEPDRSQARLEVVKRMRREPAKVIEFDAEQAGLILQREELKTLVKGLGDELERVETGILLALGNAEAATLPDNSVLTYYEQRRKSYVVDESKFRVMRIKKAKADK